MTEQDAELVAHLANADGLRRVEVEAVELTGDGFAVSATNPVSRRRVTFQTREEFDDWHESNVEE